jgi:hypothetical protein
LAYRNGTYVAFHASGTTFPIASDIKYYNLLKAWTAKRDDDFAMINSHDKTAAVRDSSKRETLKFRIKTRLRNSKNLLLIIGNTTKYDTDWVPFEIRYAIDDCCLPIIASYIDFESILNPLGLSYLWPSALMTRINNGAAHVIHIPFKKEPIKAAINQFNHTHLPKSGLSYYSRETYTNWGIRTS